MDSPKHVKEPYLEWIANGTKVYEGRLLTKVKEWDLYIGKRLSFYNGNKIINVEVTTPLRTSKGCLHPFPSFLTLRLLMLL